MVFQAQFIDLRGAILKDVDLSGIPLDGVLLDHADLTRADLRKSRLYQAHLANAILNSANMQNVSLSSADLQGAKLEYTFMEGASLHNCHLEGANLIGTRLAGAVLDGVFFDHTTKFENVYLADSKHGGIILGDVYWNGVNLSNVNWAQVKILGDERWADQVKKRKQELLRLYTEEKKDHARRWGSSAAVPYKRAGMTYYKLAKALQEQGLSDDARRFAYRSCVLKRKALFQQGKILSYFGSLFLDLLSGYGYHPAKSFMVYALVIGIFMTIYHLAGHNLGWLESFVISMSAFHGRGFFPGTFSPGDPLSLAGAFEALIGLIIEVTFIATLSQRLFNK